VSSQTGAPAFASEADRVRAIAAAILIVALVGVGLSLTIPLLSLELERMGRSASEIGLNTAIAGIASILIVPFVPALAARIGVGRLLALSVLVLAASFPLFKALWSYEWWFPLRFVFSMALGALFVLSEYWINAAAPPERRGLVMGIYATVLALGFALGPAIMLAVGTQGWPPYLAGAALFATAALPLLAARDLSPRIERHGRTSFAAFLMAAPAATLAALVFGCVETGGFSLLPVYGLRTGREADSAAALVSWLALGNVAFQIPIGLISDRMDRRLILLLIGLAGAAGAAAIPAASPAPFGFPALLFVWGGITGALYTVGLAHLGERFGAGDLAQANAAFVLLYNVGLVIGPPLVGAGMDFVPPHGFAWALTGLFAAYILIVGGRLVSVRRLT
jgi:MFS family permease